MATQDSNGGSLRAQGRRKSLFPALDNIPSDASFDFVSGSTNYKIPVADFFAALNVTGTIRQAGDPLASPVLDVQGVDNFIRNIENGPGVKASIGAQNGIKVDHNFSQGVGGAPVLLNPKALNPTIGNIFAGSGISVAATAEGVQVALTDEPVATNTVIINTMFDFPPAVSGVRKLQGGTDYFITDSLTTTDRFDVSEGNVLFRASDSSIVTFTYMGTGDLFTGVDVSFRIGRITLSAPVGRCWNLTDATGTGIFQFIDGNIRNCDKIGLISGSNFGAVQLNNVGMFGVISDGLEFNGSIGAFLALTNIGVMLGGALFNLGASTFGSFSVDDTLIDLVGGGASFISGRAASANIVVGGLGTVVNTRVRGAGTPLIGVGPDDGRWQFLLNDEIRDTRTDAMLSLSGNATATVIAASNTPVKVETGNTWVNEGAAQFTVDNTGRATYTGSKDVRLPITISTTAAMVSGGTNPITLYLAVNGVVVPNSGAPNDISTVAGRTTLVWQVTLSPNDFVELWVENNSGTTNILVSDAVQRVN